MRLLPLLVALLLLPLSGLTAGFSAEAPSTTDRWIVITDSPEGLEVSTVAAASAPLAAQPAHEPGAETGFCGGFAPLVVDCSDKHLGHADWLEHELLFPACLGTPAGSCYAGTLESVLIGQYNQDAPRMLRCEVAASGAATGTLVTLDGATEPVDLGPLVEASYHITCETSGLFPSHQRWGQFCTSDHLEPLSGPGGVGNWGCRNDWHDAFN